MITYVAIDQPVSAIQMDIRTTAQPVIAPGITSKQLSCRQGPVSTASPPLLSGYWRCLVFGLNQETITGRIIDVPASILGITNVVASSPEGTAVTVTVGRVSQPQNVRASVSVQ